jgi:protein TonB
MSPPYPRSARAAGIEGTVRITALVEASGAVASAEVSISSGNAALDRAALEEVRRTSFQPAVQNGKAVACRLIIPIRFLLN